MPWGVVANIKGPAGDAGPAGPSGHLLVSEFSPAAGTADNTAALQAAIDAGNAQGKPVIIDRDYTHASTLLLYNGSTIRGSGQYTKLTYTGAGTGAQIDSQASRKYRLTLDNLMLESTTGMIGLDLTSVSSSTLTNVMVNQYDTGFKLGGTSGWCVYNTFINCMAQNATVGFDVGPSGANSNRFYGCRTNICTTGARVTNSNQNTFTDCQFESGGTGLLVTATANALSDSNAILFCRFETNTLGWHVDTAFVRSFWAIGNHLTGNTTSFTDLGARTSNYLDNSAPNAYHVLVRRTSNATLPGDHVGYSVPWQDVVKDGGGGMHSMGNPSRITIPSGREGFYRITASVSITGTAGYRLLGLLVNGTTLHRGMTVTAGNPRTDLTATWDLQLATGNYVEVLVQHSGGAGLLLEAIEGVPRLSMYRVGK